MTEKSVFVRVPKPGQARAREIASEQGTTVGRLFAEIVTAYADGPIEPAARAVPRDQRTMTEVLVPADVAERAAARAAAEKRSLSSVIEDHLAAVS